ncbi:MAG TPA: ATP-binding cassette domain-containing protein, partial [Spirochaetia bacterium]|nr:ATP-binding cassette domain-containing protein [Spirochaetia bacterium]
EGSAVDDDADPCADVPVDLVVRDLQFRYSSRQPWILRGLSFEAPAGSRLAVVGPTGAGKSTLVSVLLRFWEYQGGSIRILPRREPGSREIDLRSPSSERSRRFFSVVPQAPHLFHASIRDNLLIAKDGAAEEELWSALRDAVLFDFVASLPEGLDTIVGETGREISVGEGQRLAVARALLRDAPVYILDEPTEGLDDSTAEKLLDSIDRRLHDRTVIIISHRARDRRMADTIVHLELTGDRA